MAKYSTEFKLKVVMEYLEGHSGYNALTKKYNISCSKRLKEWVAAYRVNGTEGIARSRQQKKYSFQFKLRAVEVVSEHRNILPRAGLVLRNQDARSVDGMGAKISSGRCGRAQSTKERQASSNGQRTICEKSSERQSG